MGIDSSVGMAIVIVIGGVCWALYIWNKPNVDDDYSTGNEKEIKDMTHNVCLDIQTKKERENMTNTELCLDLLRNLGCKYIQDEECNTQYKFLFYNEVLILVVRDNYPFVRIYDIGWKRYPTSNLEMISLARKAVNEGNKYSWRNKLFYTIEDDSMWINSDAIFVISKDISNLDQYFKSTLDCLLEEHKHFDDVMYNLLKTESQ